MSPGTLGTISRWMVTTKWATSVEAHSRLVVLTVSTVDAQIAEYAMIVLGAGVTYVYDPDKCIERVG